MARQARIDAPGALHHIIIRGIERKAIFRDDRDRERFLERIRQHVRENLSIDRDDFDLMPILSDAGGWAVARRAFGETDLDDILHRVNEAIAA